MKNVRATSFTATLAVLFIVFVATVSWQADKNKPSAYPQNTHRRADTSIPAKPANPHQTELQLNLDSVVKEVNKALSAINYEKINADIQKSLANIDFKKMNLEMKEALKNINFDSLKANVSASLDSANAAMANIDWEGIKAELKQAQAEVAKELAAQKLNPDSISRQVQQALKDAQKGLQQAQAEIALQHGLPNALAKDGLLDAGKPYTIELKNGFLYINGNKQSKAVTDKYKSYYGGKTAFEVTKEQEEASL